MLSVGLALGFGFVGGQLFPLVFCGACVGAAVCQWFQLNIAIVIPMCIVAVPCAFVPAIITLAFTTRWGGGEPRHRERERAVCESTGR
jgi:H+/Cl- antiporter ClcA